MRSLTLLSILPAMGLGYLLGSLGGDRITVATPTIAAPLSAPASASKQTGERQLQGGEQAGRVAEAASTRRSAAVSSEAAPQGGTMPEDNDRFAQLLEDFLSTGVLQRRFQQEPEALLHFAIEEYLEAGDSWRAWQLLCDFAPLGRDYLHMVSATLKEQGHLAAATTAAMQALRLDPSDEEVAELLAELDPHGALQILDRALLEEPLFESSSLPLQSIRLLLAQGMTEEAQRRLQELLAKEWTHPELWELVSECGSEFAETQLRASTRDDPHGEARLRLARYLQETGSSDEELTILLSEVLTEQPGSLKALNMLGELDPEAALAAMRSCLADQPANAPLWAGMAEQLLVTGQTGEAVEAFLRAFEESPNDYHWLWRVQEHAPERFWPIAEEAARQRNDDELWGDLADSLWAEGRHEEARSGWERARGIDPEDGEWIGKLRSVNEAEDPLGDIQWGWSEPLFDAPLGYLDLNGSDG